MDDIAPLAGHFLRRYSGCPDIELTDSAISMLTQYAWPGNVRELANAMERVVILADEKKRVTEETLSFLRLGAAGPDTEMDKGFRLPPKGISLEDLENELVTQALEVAGNNQTAAAKLLGITRAKFRVMLKKVKKERR